MPITLITLSLNFSTYEITFRSPFHLSNTNYCPLIRKIAFNIPKQSMLTPCQNISESSSQLYQPHVQLFEFYPSSLIQRRFYLLLNWLFQIVYPIVAFWAHINSTAQSTFNTSFTVLGYSRRLNSFIQKSLSKYCFEVNSIWSSLCITTNGGDGKYALSKSTVTDQGKTINWHKLAQQRIWYMVQLISEYFHFKPHHTALRIPDLLPHHHVSSHRREPYRPLFFLHIHFPASWLF